MVRDVRDNLDLAQLQAAGRGFILNARRDRRLAHAAGCEAVGAMVTSAYPKMFLDDPVEARSHLNERFGVRGWSNCGYCGGVP